MSVRLSVRSSVGLFVLVNMAKIRTKNGNSRQTDANKRSKWFISDDESADANKTKRSFWWHQNCVFFVVSNIHHWIFLTLYEMLQGQDFSLGLSHMKRYVNMYLKGMSKYPFRMVVCMLLMFVVDMWNQTSAKQQCQHFFLSLWKFLFPGIETIFLLTERYENRLPLTVSMWMK